MHHRRPRRLPFRRARAGHPRAASDSRLHHRIDSRVPAIPAQPARAVQAPQGETTALGDHRARPRRAPHEGADPAHATRSARRR